MEPELVCESIRFPSIRANCLWCLEAIHEHYGSEEKCFSFSWRSREMQTVCGKWKCHRGARWRRERSLQLHQLWRCWFFDLHYLSRLWCSTTLPRSKVQHLINCESDHTLFIAPFVEILTRLFFSGSSRTMTKYLHKALFLSPHISSPCVYFCTTLFCSPNIVRDLWPWIP